MNPIQKVAVKVIIPEKTDVVLASTILPKLEKVEDKFHSYLPVSLTSPTKAVNSAEKADPSIVGSFLNYFG